MKRQLLFLLLCMGFVQLSSAQCTPDPQYADEEFGVWPDINEGFAPATVGESYTQVINVKVPTNGGAINPDFSAYPVDSVQIVGVTGLPSGIEYACNVEGCMIPGGAQGCAALTGIPTEAQTYYLTIQATIYSNLLGTVIPFPYEFTGYQLVVSGTSDLEEMWGEKLVLQQNVPNPASSRTEVQYFLPQPGLVNFKIYDLVGKTVFEKELKGSKGGNTYSLNLEDFDNGIYIYSITAFDRTITKRMIVNR